MSRLPFGLHVLIMNYDDPVQNWVALITDDTSVSRAPTLNKCKKISQLAPKRGFAFSLDPPPFGHVIN